MVAAKLGLIGTSWWAEMMYLSRLADDPNGRVVALCGRNNERRGEIAGRYGIPAQFSDYREMLAAGGLDAVLVVTPDDQHRDMVLAAAAAGLHVLCEKPLATNAADAWMMQRAIAAAGVIGMVLFTWRWQPHFRLLKEMLNAGAIGRPTRAAFSFLGGFAFEPTYQWRLDPARATGVAGDLGSHMIDMARWLLGDITAVTARLTSVVDRRDIEGHAAGGANDAALLLLEHDGGVETSIDVSVATNVGDRFMTQSATIEGETGRIEISHVFGGAEAGVRFQISRGGPFEPVTIPADWFGTADPADLLDIYGKTSIGPRLFTQCIAEGGRAVPDFNDGAKVQDVVDAALASSHKASRVAL